MPNVSLFLGSLIIILIYSIHKGENIVYKSLLILQILTTITTTTIDIMGLYAVSS